MLWLFITENRVAQLVFPVRLSIGLNPCFGKYPPHALVLSSYEADALFMSFTSDLTMEKREGANCPTGIN